MAQVIYKITNLVNDKFYVGSTTNQRERFRTHRKKLRSNKHHCKHLQAAWNKYGEEKFSFTVVQLVTDTESLQAAEDTWLQEHVGKPYCYNSGTRSGDPWRGALKEAHPNFGKPKTEEQRQQISTALKEHYAAAPENHPRYGKTHSEETKERIRQAKLAKPTRAWLGKQRSVETKAKISETQKGVPKGPRTYTPKGLARAQENMRRNAREQAPKSFAEVLAKFPPDVQARYDFSNAVYSGALVRIEKCVCPVHGVFSQYAAQFRKGRGCPECGAEQRAKSKKQQMLHDWSTPEGRERFMKNR